MKAQHALIAWTPLDVDMPTKGKVEIRPLFDDDLDWTLLYSHSGGAACVDRRDTRRDASVMRLFEDFKYLLVEERLDPEAVHKAFLKIDEYADLFGGPKHYN